MNPIKLAKQLIENNEVQEASKNLLEDALAALLGDPISVAKIVIALAKSPFFIRDQIFWTKLEMFVSGVYRDPDDQARLCAKLTVDGNTQDAQMRLIECIDRAETKNKVQYLINATRCLLSDFINLDDYFRICHAVTHTLAEDLIYLRLHIQESDLAYNNNVQGLFTSGLMYQSILGEDIRYSFTPIAKFVDIYAVSYEDVNRYPNPTEVDQSQKLPSVSIATIDEQVLEKALGDRTATDEEVRAMIDEVFGPKIQNKTNTFIGATEPSGMKSGDLWIQTTD